MSGVVMNGRQKSSGTQRWAGILLLFMIPIVLAGLAMWFGSEYRRLGSNEDEAQRAHTRQLLLSELFSAIKDAETGQRGYVLTGNDTFLDPYRSGEQQVKDHFEELRAIPTSSAEDARLDKIEELTRAKFLEMERVIIARRTSGLEASAAMVSEGRGKKLMDDIRAEAELASAAEADMLDQTLQRQDARTGLTEQIIWLVVVLTALIAGIIGFSLWRADRQRELLEEQADEASARMRAIFDGALDAIVLINPSGSIETINRAARELFGYSDEELIRRDISFVVDLAPGTGPFLDRIGLGTDGLAEPFRAGLRVQRSNATTVPVEAALGVMSLPDGVHIVAAFRDVSEREKAERIKDQFLSTVSHELRTPLTSIIGSLGLLRGGIDGEMSPGVQRLVVIAENNANRLIRLVNDLLDIEKFESGAMSFTFEPVNLREGAVKAIDAIRGFAEKQDVTLEIAPETDAVIVRADGDRLIQVMTNLLANAVRFTPSGRKVALGITRRAGHVEVSVIDEGPGIDEELRGRLFTRFAQSIQSPVGATRGTGLGLAISREIVRSHGGEIWYEPAPAGGSAFTFSLPLWNAATEQHDHDGAPRVLICASADDTARIVGALENRAIRADSVQTTDELREALGRRRYLSLLLDCNAPGVDGDSVIRDIRANPETRVLPIVAMVDGAEEPGRELASIELVDWIPRPFDPGRLNDAIASVMANARHRMPLILHVDDDTDTLEITAAALEGRARMVHATDIATARIFIGEHRPDVVIVDLALPDGSGEELAAELASAGETPTPVIIYSAQERGEFAREVSAVLTKSTRSLSALVETVIDILDRQGIREEDDG